MGCKSSLVFLNYSIMANFFWLLVEALYLHTLLLVVHARYARLSVYLLIGWGRTGAPARQPVGRIAPQFALTPFETLTPL